MERRPILSVSAARYVGASLGGTKPDGAELKLAQDVSPGVDRLYEWRAGFSRRHKNNLCRP